MSVGIKVVLLGLRTAGIGVSAAIWLPVVAQLPEYFFLVALAGAAGGLARWIADKSDVLDGIGAVISGVLVAAFLWPAGQALLEEYIGKLDLEPVTSVMMGGFITGVLGLTLVGAILDIFRARKKRLEVVDDTE